MGINWLEFDRFVPYQNSPKGSNLKVREALKIKAQKKVEAHGEQVTDSKLKQQAAKAYKRAQLLSFKNNESIHTVLVESIMSHPVETLSPDTSRNSAIDRIREYHYHHFPVVEEGKLIGLISARDLLRKQPSPKHSDLPEVKDGQELSVKHLLSNRCLTARPSSSVKEVGMIMVQEDVGSVPIVNEEREVVGIVTASDILECIILHTPFDTLK